MPSSPRRGRMAVNKKGTDVPYLAHIMDVAALVLMNDGDESQAIAALLHDVAEDAGGRDRLDDVRRRFSEAVAEHQQPVDAAEDVVISRHDPELACQLPSCPLELRRLIDELRQALTVTERRPLRDERFGVIAHDLIDHGYDRHRRQGEA